MRVFLAVELADAVRDRIAALERRLGAEIRTARWVARQNLHVTLRFLGELDRAPVEAIITALPEATRRVATFPLTLAGVGAFPSPNRARVLWAGIAPVPPELSTLHAELESLLRRHGHDADDRPFEPHVTIARLKAPDRGVPGALGSAAGLDFGTTTVSELVFFASHLTPKGARYEPLARIPFGGTSRKQLV